MRWAYYNEFDQQKAAWLRELIRRNLIAPGEVDERSIHDVQPGDLDGFAQCHFFAGIGIWSYALRLAGWPDEREAWTGSCPCQPFSAAGKGEAFNDERHLWPELFRLIEARRPIVCFGEQVASIDGLAWLDLVQFDLDRAGYTCGAVDLCAAGVGAPHRRQRLYWVADAAERGIGSLNGESRPSTGREGAIRRYGILDRLGHASGAGLEERQRQPGDAGPERAAAERTGDAGGLANTQSGGCREFRDAAHAGSCGHDDGGSVIGGVDDAASARSDRALDPPEGDSRDGARLRLPSERGPVNGFWRSADWVLTRPQRVGDRPSLRPVESRSFPLAHGASARVGRLRGYGDGIVAPLTEAFVRAYLAARVEG